MVAVVLNGILVACQSQGGAGAGTVGFSPAISAFCLTFFLAMLRTAHPAGMYTRALAPVR
jgi:hypothetical protein